MVKQYNTDHRQTREIGKCYQKPKACFDHNTVSLYLGSHNIMILSVHLTIGNCSSTQALKTEQTSLPKLALIYSVLIVRIFPKNTDMKQLTTIAGEAGP